MPAVNNFTLPLLSIHTQPTPPTRPVSVTQDRPARKQAATKTPSPSQTGRFDRDSLPSMVKAATTHEPSNLKMVVLASADDGDQSDSSSICHSPTWDDYGKKKRKDADARRRRLTKEPPPAAMENRPSINPRARSDPTLLNKYTRQSLDSLQPSPPSSAQTEGPSLQFPSQSIGVETVETVARSPGFIGGVRLEREREATMTRLINARTPSEERPASGMMLRNNQTQPSLPVTDLAKKRETAPATSYPPTASKSPFLKQPNQPTRARRGSIGLGLKAAAGKLFNSKDKDPKIEQSFHKNESQESVQTVQTWFSSSHSRGRQMSGDTITHSRGQSYDSHERFTGQGEKKKKGGIRLPPVTWKNKRQNRSTSMIAVPPDSARDGSFPHSSPEGSPRLKQDNFGFLERPFSPPADGQLSPPGSLSASMKAKMSPQLTPTSATSSDPAWQPSSKKTLKDTLKAGFRTSFQTPEVKTARRRSGTIDTLVGTDTQISQPREGLPSQDHPVAVQSSKSSPALKSKGTRRLEEQHAASPIRKGQPGAHPKDSGASSSSSHPDTESQPPSPMTTPDTSRPQSSSKDIQTQTLRVEDLRKMSLFSHDSNNFAVRYPGVTALGDQSSGYFSSKKPESSHTHVDQSSGSPKQLVERQRQPSGPSSAESLPTAQRFLTDELWTKSKKPLDPDQMSFTSALTSLDVKTSFTELGAVVHSAPLQSPNRDVTPMSLDRKHKDANSNVTIKKVEFAVTHAPAEFKQPYGSDVSSRSSNQNLPPRTNGRPTQVPPSGTGTDQRSVSSHARIESLDSSVQPSKKASAYLKEARKAAPSSPRAPSSKTSSHTSLPASDATSLASPRTFALTTAGPSQFTPLSTAAVPSPLSSDNKKTSDILGKPMTKMLVECCHCRFYHDMPSRVYGAMAQPDDVVKDKRLGVSGQVTTCVKCPWCSHNMSTVCCAGYAAVVYLREKLHGP